jgi:hypothetical protein
MSNLISLIPAALLFLLYSFLLVRAAHVCRRTMQRPSDGRVFALLGFVLVALGGLANEALGRPVQPEFAGVLAVVAHVALGGGYLRSRLQTNGGAAASFSSGMLVAATAYAMLLFVLFCLALAATLLIRLTQA